MSNELRGMAASLRVLTADIAILKERLGENSSTSIQGTEELLSGDFSALIPVAKASTSCEISQKVSSLLIVVKDLKPEEKKPRGSILVKFMARIEGHTVLVASATIQKDGSSVITIPACGLNSTIELEFDGTAEVQVWGI